MATIDDDGSMDGALAPPRGREELRRSLVALTEGLGSCYRKLDTSWTRELIEMDELGLAIDDLTHELARRPRLPGWGLAALHDLAILVGASASAVTALAAMTARVSVLALDPRELDLGGRAVEYRELMVDGVAINEGLATMFDIVEPDLALAALDRLEGRAPGPAVIGVCLHCGQPECGTVAVLVEVGPDLVRWSNAVDIDPPEASEPWTWGLGPFRFERAPYLAVIAQLRAGLRP